MSECKHLMLVWHSPENFTCMACHERVDVNISRGEHEVSSMKCDECDKEVAITHLQADYWTELCIDCCWCSSGD